jgi:putative transposase
VALPTLKRQAVTYIMDQYGLNAQRACRLVRQARSTHYYRSIKDPQTALRQRMHALTWLSTI